MPERLLTPRDVAERTTLSVGKLCDMRRDGTGPAFIPMGRRIAYRETAVEAWLAQLETSSTRRSA